MSFIDFEHDVTACLLECSQSIPALQQTKRKIVLGLSGGMDSSALLVVLSSKRIAQHFDVFAAYVDHGLHNDSKKWGKHCQVSAATHNIPLRIHSVSTKPKPGESKEAWAREARYSWFEEIIGPGDLLLTAHHQDDQLETFMLQLIRGAGPHGLSGIRKLRKFGLGYLLRPLLNKTRTEIADYIKEKRIAYIEDPSNRSQSFDRNYLRLEVLPRLRDRWPHIAASVLHASQIQQVVADDFDERAVRFLEQNTGKDGGLALPPLLTVQADFRFSIFRQWCLRSNVSLLERRHFNEIEKAVFATLPSPTLKIEWKNAVLRYFRGQLFLGPRETTFDVGISCEWDLAEAVTLPNGELTVQASMGEGISPEFQHSRVSVAYYRRVGERCHPATRTHSQTLKKLFQEWGVPPWRRDQVPIVWINGKIAAVVPYCTCRGFTTGPEQNGLLLKFKPTNSSEILRNMPV